MNQEFINLKDQQVLTEIKEYLEKMSIAGTLLESGPEMPHNVLIAITSEQLSVNIMYVPLPEDQFEESRLLQFYSMVHSNISHERLGDFMSLLNEVNNQCPLGSFTINEKSELSYKFIFPIDRFEIPKEFFIQEIFNLYINTLKNFYQALLDLNNGSLGLTEVIQKLRS